jgi:hydroxymethylglutaryl-CoA lyase
MVTSFETWRMPTDVVLTEVGPRDGFQMERAFIPTETKIEIIDRVSGTGVREVEVTSFVHPRAIPQLADAEEVLAGIQRPAGVVFTALVPNERGAERALRVRIDRVETFVSVSESHSRSNSNMATQEAMERAGRVVRICREAGVDAAIGFPTALGCPFEGFQPLGRLMDLIEQAVNGLGLTRINIADTAGMAGPGLVRRMLGNAVQTLPDVSFSLHLHNTRSMGLANVLAGLEVGVRHFDTSLAGLGGCPYAPGATGNIATEDTINMLNEMGIATGIDLDAMIAAARLAEQRIGHSNSGMLRAGTSQQLVGQYSGAQAKLA